VNEGPDSVFVCVQIETREAIQAIDEIVAIKGLDSIVFGPWDLSASYGMLGQITHPTVIAAMEGVIAKALAAGKYVGCGGGSDPAYVAGMIRRGVQWFQYGGDYGYLIYAATQLIEAVHAAVNGQAPTTMIATRGY
jgi:4-hydroxy-2-oxoheptanedioate aldolase